MDDEPDWTDRSDVRFLIVYGWVCVSVVAFGFWAIDPLMLFAPL